MAELAINQYGEAFAPPTEAAHWLVRRMNDNKHGGPMPTFGKEGKPITLPLTATLADFQAALRAHNCPTGRYRLDPLDTAGRLMKGAPVAYLPYPPDRQGPTAPADAAELPRNGNQPAGMAWGGPAPMPPLAWSTGGAFPLPTPNHLTGAEYLLGEALRAQTSMLTIMAQASATASAQHASAMSALLTAAAELVRAADGAKMPTRRPTAAPPPVIVQHVAPAYAEAYADVTEEEPEPAPEAAAPSAPSAPPVWQQKVGEVVDSLLPVAKMVINHKMADFMAGGGAEAPTVAPRNAAEVAPAPEPAPEPEPAVDVTPAAWSHLGAVVRMLGPAWKARVDAQLARMSPEEQRAFVCSLVSLTRPAACEYVVGQVSIAEVRQARTAPSAAATEPTAAPTAPSAAPSAPTAPPAAPTAPAAASVDAPTALPDTTDGPHAPTEAELPRLTPPSGPAAQATIRGIVNEVMGDHAAPAAPTAATAPTAAGPGALAGLVNTLASETSVIAPYLRRIPGGGAGVEALAATFLGAEALAQINAELDAVPVPPVLQLMQARAAAPTKPAAPTAPAAPAASAASPLADPAVMARMVEVMPHLTAAEQATAQLLATRMPAGERNKLLGHLMAGSVADAVAFVRDAVTKYEAHGRPFG